MLSSKPDIYQGLSFSPIITDKHSSILRIALTSDDKFRIFTELKDIHPDMLTASLLYEDKSFYEHSGVNFFAIGRAIFSMAQGGRRLGASTITMQLARLSYKIKTNTLRGKLHQMWLAFMLEHHYSKEEILEAYLNLAPYGGNVEGVGAAAQIWFKVNPKYLNKSQILTLVSIPQNPLARHPHKQDSLALAKAKKRLNSLWSGKENPLDVFLAQVQLRLYSVKDMPFEVPHLTSFILNNPPHLTPDILKTSPRLTSSVLEKSSQIEKNKHFSRRKLSTKDFTIQTSIDLEIQKKIENIVHRYIDNHKSYGLHNASIVLANWQNGEIMSYIGSKDFFDESISGQVDGVLAKRSPGSTLKPFIYALALEQGLIHSKTILADTEKIFHGYHPENSDGSFEGPIPADKALYTSRNIPAIDLASQLSSPNLYDFLRLAGINFPYGEEYYGLALVLGGAELSPLELTNLYTLLANQGMYKPLSFYSENKESRGDVKRLLSAESSYIIQKILQQASPSGYVSDIAWKTGTSNGQRDAWTIGFFGPYVLTVWLGNFDNSSQANLIGRRAASPLFFEIAQYLQQQRGYTSLEEVQNNKDLNVKEIAVCASTGDVDTKLCLESPQVNALFIPGVSPIKRTGILREILINKKSSLRDCLYNPEINRKEIWEFWPVDMRILFEEAGVYKKAIPSYAPYCLDGTYSLSGLKPSIQSPKTGLKYMQSLSSPKEIPLRAFADADAKTLTWFVNSEFLATASTDAIVMWKAKIGHSRLKVVDDLGRHSSMDIFIDSIP